MHKNEAELAKVVDVLRHRRSQVDHLLEVADTVCKKLESPTASVTILDQENLRAAIDAVRNQTFLGN